jgi:hypothetical protein
MSDESNQTAIRAALGKLCTKGVEPYWVTDHARALLDLRVVRDGLDESATDAELVEALVEYLRSSVERVDWAQHRILLTIVMALDPQYLGWKASERRTEAGRLFRGGRDPVSEGTIRQHHEPNAVDKLAGIVVADEARAHDPKPLF